MRQYTFPGLEIHACKVPYQKNFNDILYRFLYPFFMGYAQFFLCRPNSIFFMLLYIFVVFNLTHVCLPPMNDHSQWILRNKFYSMHIEAHSSEPLVNLKMKRTITRFFFQDRGKKLLSQFIPWNSNQWSDFTFQLVSRLWKIILWM